ncbi:hypothetical protein ACQKIE_16130 [Luteibacter sp. NPDC031894]|uniref:hypothetical protein n=1 Tax=Luteibacter sp. NPDC031894 TaxID=3390572 RepID=UPI003CFF500F
MELDEAIARVEATEAEAITVALRHIALHAPFLGALADAGDRDLSDFQRIAATRVVEQGEMLRMAEKNLSRFVGMLRTRTAIYPQLNGVRLSVLAHVALAIRLQPLLECKPLWTAVDRQDWDDAADALLMTRWPEKAVDDGEKRRVLELARMMRTGTEPPSLAA